MTLHALAGLTVVTGAAALGGKVPFVWLWWAVCAVGAIQTIPLPTDVLAVIAPGPKRAWEVASDAIGRPLETKISVAPGQTVGAVCHLLLMTMVFTVTAGLTRNARWARFVGWTVSLAAGVVLCWGLSEWLLGVDILGTSQQIRWPFGYKNPLLPPIQTAAFGRVEHISIGSIPYSATYWVVGDMFGPYLVSNHFGGCLELTVPVLLALLLSLRGKAREHGQSVLDTLPLLMCATLALLAFIVLIYGASARAGSAGLILGVTWVAWGALSEKRRVVGLILFVIATIGYVCLFLISLFAEQIVTITRRHHLGVISSALIPVIGGAQWRESQWQLCLRMFADSPWFGFGLGSYSAASPSYTMSPVRTGFAHCDYF